MGLKRIIKKAVPRPIKKITRAFLDLLKLKKYSFHAKLHPSDTTFYCPCCDIKFQNFISGNYNKKPDIYNIERYKNIMQEVQCPVCYTIPRHRILATWMNKHIDELKNKKILYFACERGMKLWLKRNRIKYTSADLYSEADLKLDIENTKQPDSSWDWIVCNHVLEHVNSYQNALKELYRIIKPGGVLICSFPIMEQYTTVIEESEHTKKAKAQRLKRFGQFDHLRVFGADSEEILEKAGFIVSRIDGDEMPNNILPVIGPADYDVNYLFLCRKPA